MNILSETNKGVKINMSEMNKIILWNKLAGLPTQTLPLDDLKGLPLGLVKEELFELLESIRLANYNELLDACGDILVVCNGLLNQMDTPIKTDSELSSVPLVSPNEALSLALRLRNNLEDLSEIDSVTKLIHVAYTAIKISLSFLFACKVSAVEVLKLINDSNFSKFCLDEFEAKCSVDSYELNTRYHHVHYEKVGDYYIILGYVGMTDRPKILKGVSFNEPDLYELALVAKSNFCFSILGGGE